MSLLAPVRAGRAAPPGVVEPRGAPRRLRLDNGPEFISATLAQWARRHHVELLHIQPRKPTQAAYIERFDRTFRTEVVVKRLEASSLIRASRK